MRCGRRKGVNLKGHDGTNHNGEPGHGESSG